MTLIEKARLHSELEMVMAEFEEISEQPVEIFAKYPLLQQGLRAQLEFLDNRPATVAFDLLRPRKMTRKLMRAEGIEVASEVLGSLVRGQAVDGRASMEGADWVIFASLEQALNIYRGEETSSMEALELVAGLTGLRLLSWAFQEFDVEQALPKKVADYNRFNWPERAHVVDDNELLQAAADRYGQRVRPLLKGLRDTLDQEERIIPPDLYDSINEMREDPPNPYLERSGLVQAYHALMQEIPL